MSEISKFETYKKKLQGVCDENDLVFRFRCHQYPITLTIRPVSGFGEQLSMLETADENYMSPDASIVFSFADGVITYKMSDRFVISDTLFQKIKNLFKNMHACWVQYFFREVIENKSLKTGTMPVIDEELAEDDELESAEEAEPGWPKSDGDADEVITLDEYLVKEGTAIVRAENKATTALLQRRLKIGYSKAAQLMDELEALGVIGPYKGAEPREVLPADVPEDSKGGELNV